MKRQKNILVVDDDLDVGDSICEILCAVYENIAFVPVPEKAAELVNESQFSLIITDVNMPLMPGPEFVRMVRAAGRLEPILFLTGYMTKEVALSALRLGASDILEKPFDGPVLIAAIENIFEMEKRRNKFYEDRILAETTVDNLNRQKKIIGLLHVANDKKKIS